MRSGLPVGSGLDLPIPPGTNLYLEAGMWLNTLQLIAGLSILGACLRFGGPILCDWFYGPQK